MNHDKLSPAKTPEARADDETLSALHKRIGDFVRAFGPDEAALATVATDESSSSAPSVYLGFPRVFLEEIAPEPTRRLQIKEFSLFDDAWADDTTAGLASGVYIEKSPDNVRFESTIYSRRFDGGYARESEPRPDTPWPLPSEDPYRASVQECADMNAILDALLQLDKEVITSIVDTEVA
jgi:hypothetical protein